MEKMNPAARRLSCALFGAITGNRADYSVQQLAKILYYDDTDELKNDIRAYCHAIEQIHHEEQVKARESEIKALRFRTE